MRCGSNETKDTSEWIPQRTEERYIKCMPASAVDKYIFGFFFVSVCSVDKDLLFL